MSSIQDYSQESGMIESLSALYGKKLQHKLDSSAL